MMGLFYEENTTIIRNGDHYDIVKISKLPLFGECFYEKIGEQKLEETAHPQKGGTGQWASSRKTNR